jgi:SNF2 family DNA or RNA helicase
MEYICPRLQIFPRVDKKAITDTIRITIGELKHTINFSDLKIQPFIFKNHNLVNFFKETDFIPLPNFYSEEIAEDMDVYGGFYTITKDNITYDVRLYFYQIFHPELITQDFIKKHELIFQQTYFIRNNILDMDYHEYRMTLFNSDMKAPKLMDLSYVQNSLITTKLKNYQKFNVKRMLDLHLNGIKIRITDNLIMGFDNDIMYDFTSRTFIKSDDITQYDIRSGILADDPGIGKTLQFITFVVELIVNHSFLKDDEKILILVPDNLKSHWISQFEKHISIPLCDLPITVYTFSEFRKIDLYRKSDIEIMKSYKLIGIDELPILYKQHNDLFDKIIRLNIPYRWGITGTPILTQKSMFDLIRFLVGKNFHNERIANIPMIQDKIIHLFLKNTKQNTIEEHNLPPIKYENIKTHLDIVYQTIYESESKSLKSIRSLQKLIGSLDLMANREIANKMTPKELKEFMLQHYKNIYMESVSELEKLVMQLKNIHDNKDKFDHKTYIDRLQNYEKLIRKQEPIVQRHKSILEFTTNSITAISKIIGSNGQEIDSDEICPICITPHEKPITYFKKCGHFFCKNCVDECFYRQKLSLNTSIISCPVCRTSVTNDDIITVDDKCEITASSKCQILINLIKSTNDRFIIFTQFPEMIDNLILTLKKYNINAIKYHDFLQSDTQDQFKVIILSSEENAAGHDLSFINRIIIFEPFEDVMYCRSIEDQLIGRIHRIGQTKNEVYVYRLITMKTIDEEIYKKFLDV